MLLRRAKAALLTRSQGGRPVEPRTISSPMPFHDPLSIEETTRIRESIRIAQVELESVSSSTISEMGRQAALNDFISSKKALLSSWRHMPAELLDLIFEETRGVWSDAVYRPPVVSQVCHRWRMIALDTPSLWANISLSFEYRFTVLNTLERMQCLLQRSRQHPLCVYVFTDELWRTQTPEFSILLESSRRWTHATLCFNDETRPGYSYLQGRIGNLNTLDLQRLPGGHSSALPEIDRTFETAPRLQHAKLRGDWAQLSFALPFRNLLSYHGVTIQATALNPLVELTSVIDLGVSFRWMIRPAIHGSQAKQLPSIESLRVHFPVQSGEIFHTFFNLIRVPNLRKLVIDIEPNAWLFVSRITPLIVSPTTLTEFVCHANFNAQGSIIELLRVTPNLRKLDILLPSVDDLGKLVAYPYKNPLLPHLCALHFLAMSSIKDHRHVITMLALNQHALPVTDFSISFQSPSITVEVERDLLQDCIWLPPAQESTEDGIPLNSSEKLNLLMMQLMELKRRLYTALHRLRGEMDISAEDEIAEDVLGYLELFNRMDAQHFRISQIDTALYDELQDIQNGLYRLSERRVLEGWVPFQLHDTDNSGHCWAISGTNSIRYVS